MIRSPGSRSSSAPIEPLVTSGIETPRRRICVTAGVTANSYMILKTIDCDLLCGAKEKVYQSCLVFPDLSMDWVVAHFQEAIANAGNADVLARYSAAFTQNSFALRAQCGRGRAPSPQNRQATGFCGCVDNVKGTS